jgi:hypothetical protein
MLFCPTGPAGGGPVGLTAGCCFINHSGNANMQKKLTRYRWVFLIFLLTVAPMASAQRLQEKEMTCPIGGESFKVTTIGSSGTMFDRSLDLKPIGLTAVSWPLVKCPSNGFVMYQQKFSDDELALKEETDASGPWLDRQLIAGELERRLGRFENAQERFEMLAHQEKAKTGSTAETIAFQMRLIKARDDQPHLVSDRQDAGK